MDWLPKILMTNAALLRSTQKYAAAGETIKAEGFSDKLLERLANASSAEKEEQLRTLAQTWLDARQTKTGAARVWLEFLGCPKARQGGDGPRIEKALETRSTPDAYSTPPSSLPAWNAHVAERAPLLVWPRRNLGKLALAAGRSAEAMDHFAWVVKTAPADHGSSLLLALAGAQAGRRTESLAALQKACASPLSPAEMVLAAHTARVLGETGAASNFLSQAIANKAPLVEGDRLLRAELALRSGDTGAVRKLLAERSADPRWDMIAAEAAAKAGKFDEALRKFAALPEDARVSSITRCAVQWAARATNPKKAVAALEAVDDELKDSDYFLVFGHLKALTGDLDGAFFEWFDMADDRLADPAVVELACSHLAAARGQGEAAAILSATGYVPSAWWQDPAFRAEFTAALHTHLRDCLQNEKLDDEALATALDEDGTIAAELPEATRAARGLVAAAREDWSVASVEFAKLEMETLSTVAPVAVRAALECEDDAQAAEFCALLPAGSHALLEAAVAASEKDWDRCFARLCEAGENKVSLECRAAVAFRIHRSVRAEGPVASFSRAVSLCRNQEWEAAAESLRNFPDAHAWADSAQALGSWIELCNPSARDDAGPNLVRLVKHWPDALDALPFSPAALLPAQLQVDRDSVAEILRLDEERCELGDSAAARRRAIFFLSEGSRAKSHSDALHFWEEAIPHLAVPLAHFGWLSAWSAQREIVFKRTLPSEALTGLEPGVLEICAALFTERAEAAVTAGEQAVGEALLGLPLLLEAEIIAARRLREAGGVQLNGAVVSAGPGFIARENGDAALREMIANLDPRRSNLLRELLEKMREDGDLPDLPLPDEREDDGRAEDLRYLFSRLRVARVLQHHGQMDRAVAAIKAARNGSGSWLARANPAFPPDDHSGFEQISHTFMVRLLNTAAEHAMAAGPETLPRALECWRELLDEAEDHGRKKEATELIQRSILGRVQFLRNERRNEEAFALLEQSLTCLPDNREINGALSLILTNQAIDAYNEDRIKDAVKLIRRAVKHGKDVPRVVEHAARILQARAHQIADENPGQARKLVDEALRHAQSLCRLVPGKYDGLENELGEMQLFFGLRTGNVGAADLSRLPAPPGSRMAVNLSTILHNQGMEKAKEERWEEAVDLFEKALELEPDSEITRQMLNNCLMGAMADAMQRQDLPAFHRYGSRMRALG